MSEATYDRIGRGYSASRRGDPKIAARIEKALGDADSILNVGAGSGSYEPTGREVTAVEPSGEMIAQRPSGAAPVVQASAERLPFPDDSFDAAMAIVSDHHWVDREAGLSEMVRVARRRVLLLCRDGFYQAYWRRPHAYLEQRVRDSISVFHRLPEAEVCSAVERLRRDLDGGSWEKSYGDLLSKPELDIGLRLVVVGLDQDPASR